MLRVITMIFEVMTEMMVMIIMRSRMMNKALAMIKKLFKMMDDNDLKMMIYLFYV